MNSETPNARRCSLWVLIFGIILLGIGVLFLYIAIVGLKTGDVLNLSSSSPDFPAYTRKDNPYRFWGAEIFLGVSGVLFFIWGVLLWVVEIMAIRRNKEALRERDGILWEVLRAILGIY